MLTGALRRVLADTFVMYVHAHGAHWNIVGPNFPSYHAFLGDLYEDLWGAVDGIAEHIRTAGSMAPGALGSLVANSLIQDVDPGSTWPSIRAQLEKDNAIVMSGLSEAFASATAVGDQGAANFLADRLDQHAKHGWMLSATQ